ncbi:MAG: hypothetical protein EOP06_26145, partial [Proteobacteria bacterium]
MASDGSAATQVNLQQHNVGSDKFVNYCSDVAELHARHAMMGYMHSSQSEHANSKIGFEPQLVKVGAEYKFVFEDSAGKHHEVNLAGITGSQKI